MKAKLSTANKKDYFVYWRDETGRLIKKRGGMNKIKSLKQRRAYGLELCEVINKNLSQGRFKPVSAKKVLDQIVETKKASLRRRSWQSYKYAVDKFTAWLPDPDLTMDQISPQIARQFMDSLKFKGKTRNGIRGFLTAVFNYYGSRNEGYINPFKSTGKSPEEVGRNVAFTPHQIETLWGIMAPELRLFTRFIYFTYIRPIELLRLRVGDVRLDLNQIVLHGSQSKNKLQQAVVIPDAFIDEIRLMEYEKMPQDWFLFGRGMKPGPNSLSRNMVSKRHSDVLRLLKYPPELTLYSWKHTGVVAAYKAGIDLYSIMRQLRHHSLDMTQIYLKSLGLVKNEQFGRLMV